MSEDLLATDETKSPQSTELRPQPKPSVDDVRKAVDTKADANDTAPAGDLLSGDEESGSDGVGDYTFDAPEGFDTSRINQDQLKQFGEAAKSMGLSQAQYQSLVEYELKRTEADSDVAVEAWRSQVKGWEEASRADKEFGGAAFAENMQHARSALNQFGTPAFRALLADPSPDNPSGLGLRHHPEIIRTLSRIGKALSDPTLVEGDAKPENEGALKRLYPSMFPNKT